MAVHVRTLCSGCPCHGCGITAHTKKLNDGLLLSDQRAKLVTGHVHAVEVQQAVVSLNILDTEPDLAVGKGLVLLEIGERNLDDTSLEVVRSDLGTLGLGNKGLSGVLDSEDGRSDKLVPFFLKERVNTVKGNTLGKIY